MKRLLLAAAALLCAATHLCAQSVRYDAQVTTTSTYNSYGSQVGVYAVPFAKISVCTYPSSPCTPVSVYADQALQSPIGSVTADGQGHFGFWIAPGTYYYTAQTASGTTLYSRVLTLSLGSGSGTSTLAAWGSITGTIAQQADLTAEVAAAQAAAVNAAETYSQNASNLLSGTLAAGRLPTSGVAAGSYGSSSAVPVITVDTYGRVTGVSTAPVSGGGAGGSGSVTNFSLGTLPSWLTGTVANSTTTPTLSLSSTVIPVSAGGTGTASPGLIAGTNVTISGTWPNQTITAAGSSGTAGVSSFNSRTGAVTPQASDYSGFFATPAQVTSALAPYAPLASPAFTGTPTVPTPAVTDSSTAAANTAWVNALLAGYGFGGTGATCLQFTTTSGATAGQQSLYATSTGIYLTAPGATMCSGGALLTNSGSATLPTATAVNQALLSTAANSAAYQATTLTPLLVGVDTGKTVTANYTATATDRTIYVNASAGAVTITLPSSPSSFQQIAVKKVDSSTNSVVVVPSSGSIDSTTSASLIVQNGYMMARTDNTNWWIFGSGTSSGSSSSSSSLTLTTTGTSGAATYSNGVLNIPNYAVSSGSGGGTVTSVGLSLPNLFTVTNSPVTGSGTLTATLASQSANTFFAAPNGAAGAPAYRSIVAADINPALLSAGPIVSTASSATAIPVITRGASGQTADYQEWQSSTGAAEGGVNPNGMFMRGTAFLGYSFCDSASFTQGYGSSVCGSTPYAILDVHQGSGSSSNYTSGTTYSTDTPNSASGGAATYTATGWFGSDPLQTGAFGTFGLLLPPNNQTTTSVGAKSWNLGFTSTATLFSAPAYAANGSAGLTTTVTVGSCVLTYTGGLLTGKSGC